MSKKVFIITALIAGLVYHISFAEGLRVNNKEAQNGSTVNLFYDDLDAGKIYFSVPAGNLKKAEITMDKGRNWEEMQEDTGYFNFAYRPLADEVIIPEFIFTTEDGKMMTERPAVKVNYQKKNPDEAVEQVLEKMKTYYEQANSVDRFMSVFSMTFPDRTRFQDAIQNDFFNYRNIRLRYVLERKAFDDDFEGAIWDVRWERKADTRTGDSIDDSAIISMRFNKESGTWLITGLRNNTIFGSSSLALPELSITATDINLIMPPPLYRISAVVHNIGTAPASNIRVDFLLEPGDTPDGTETIVGPLDPGSSYTIIHNTSGIPAFDIKVVIDPLGVIQEGDRSNNSAQKHFP